VRGATTGSLYRDAVGYEVQTPVFEGPFDLLLHLILRDQVDLYEVSLNQIVDAFITELERMESLDLEVATEFLLIAATLVELKARRLLPGDPDPDLDDELGRWEERDLLLARLLECKTFKDAAVAFESLASLAGRSAPRRAGLEERFVGLVPDLLEGVTAADLAAAMVRASLPRPSPVVDTSHLHMVRASVSDAVVELADELPRVGRVGFRELTSAFVERLEVVVRFLALLELFKQGLVELTQPLAHGDILIVWTGTSAGSADLDLVDSYDG
jgi:segregation and condensation protein A